MKQASQRFTNLFRLYYLASFKRKEEKDYTPKDGAAYGGKIWLEHPVHGEILVERYKQQNRGKSKVLLMSNRK